MELETGGQPLDLRLTLNSGQAFRWREDNGWFSGIVRGCFIKIRQRPSDKVEFRSNQPDDAAQGLLHSYFRLDDDIEAIYSHISLDPKIATLVDQYRGLRILRQEPWECLVAYILSARSGIEGQISRNVEKLANEFGDPVTLDGVTLCAFPTPERIVEAGIGELDQLVLGLKRRSHYIYRAAHRVMSGQLDLESLRRMPLQDVEVRLMEGRLHNKPANGIRLKIANCILLFSLDKLDAFPIDTHIETALLEHYRPDMRPATGHRRLRDYELRKLMEWSRDHFGPYAGYAGQFLFHDQRMQQRRR